MHIFSHFPIKPLIPVVEIFFIKHELQWVDKHRNPQFRDFDFHHRFRLLQQCILIDLGLKC